MSKEIKGAIQYIITIDDKGNWDFKFEPSIENKIAALASASFATKEVMDWMQKEIDKDTKNKKHIKAVLGKIRAGHFGLGLTLDHMRHVYTEYQKLLVEKEKAQDKFKELLKTPPTAEA